MQRPSPDKVAERLKQLQQARREKAPAHDLPQSLVVGCSAELFGKCLQAGRVPPRSQEPQVSSSAHIPHQSSRFLTSWVVPKRLLDEDALVRQTRGDSQRLQLIDEPLP